MQKLASAAARAFLLERYYGRDNGVFSDMSAGLMGKWTRRQRVNNSEAINCKSAWLWCSLVIASEAKMMPINGRREY